MFAGNIIFIQKFIADLRTMCSYACIQCGYKIQDYFCKLVKSDFNVFIYGSPMKSYHGFTVHIATVFMS